MLLLPPSREQPSPLLCAWDYNLPPLLKTLQVEMHYIMVQALVGIPSPEQKLGRVQPLY